MHVPKYLKYSKDHEWANYDEDEGVVIVGITEYAQSKIGDITYVELPEEGDDTEKGTSFAEIEHHKGVEEVYSPVSGRVFEVNDALSESPELINQDPYEDGWLVKIEPGDLSELDEMMDAEEYEEYLSELQEED
ncbi:MAG: glycine cleavage system protein GcvH [Deltaproteobacteria bacterium]|nr:glycine cleavage system protein GcvH [Deltaproteobacteria bacterium]